MLKTKAIASLALLCSFLSASPTFAQAKTECPPEGYYGAMSQVCPPPARTTETWEANELQKRIQARDNGTQIVCAKVPGWRNDETDVGQRCQRVSESQP